MSHPLDLTFSDEANPNCFGWHDEDSITDGGRLSNVPIAWAKQAIPNSPCRQKNEFLIWFWEGSLREICRSSHFFSPFLASSRNWAPARKHVRLMQFLNNTILSSIAISFYCNVEKFWNVQMLPPILASYDFSVDRFRHATRLVHPKRGWKVEWKFFHTYIWVIFDEQNHLRRCATRIGQVSQVVWFSPIARVSLCWAYLLD